MYELLNVEHLCRIRVMHVYSERGKRYVEIEGQRYYLRQMCEDLWTTGYDQSYYDQSYVER